ncbi:MAG TPA: TAXI family TRAP transporter solute-binding subunit [Polaromonas sp.]|uniref:TAXI family TRAP transporter solute-binding subunit n=1 Tax=Polaromonas sp. TaxID=1869339 RepID=UPI002D53D7A2|nr:TAXI family TRAP transporter solute-binding subunit [Polaromonas sp.]HYW58634.1 TAXI family TRAP transporter solute-binding subunit [Polaromonas sp.]
MTNEARGILNDWLKRVQRNERLRKTLAFLLILVLLGIAGHYVYEVLPRTYSMRITGGDILGNRHYLAGALRDEVLPNGVSLDVLPSEGSQEALAEVSEGKLDFALIQGGLELPYPNVSHVANLAPELLHFLVRPDIKDIAGMRGMRINLGSKKGGTRVIAKQLLAFSGMHDGVDYVETNLSTEDLLALRKDRMPDVIVITSFAPSNIADYIVRQHGYSLLEIPFPSALALRQGWVADTKVMAYMYSVQPPVPPRDVKTVGVNLQLVANSNLDPRAVFKVLEGVYSPGLQMRLKMKFDEDNILESSNYPLSSGTRLFMDRKNPFLSQATLKKIESLFGLILSVASTLIVVFKWFKGAPPEEAKPETDDAFFVGLAERALAVDSSIDASPDGLLSHEQKDALQRELSDIKATAMRRLSANGPLANANLVPQLFATIADSRARLEFMRGKT